MSKIEKIMSRVTIMLVTILLVTSCSSHNFFWSHTYYEDEADSVEYGLLYNWYATQGTGTASLTSSDDWSVATYSQIGTLRTTLGDNNLLIKESGLNYWNTDNGINSTLFNARGSGARRQITGIYTDQKDFFEFWTGTAYNATDAWTFVMGNTTTFISRDNETKTKGLAIRLLYVGTGTPTSYTGNDGHVYRVVTIGTQTWLADNLMETRFRNGDIIPWHGANPANYFTDVEWAALTTAGVCAYNNTLSNVANGFTFP